MRKIKAPCGNREQKTSINNTQLGIYIITCSNFTVKVFESLAMRKNIQINQSLLGLLKVMVKQNSKGERGSLRAFALPFLFNKNKSERGKLSLSK